SVTEYDPDNRHTITYSRSWEGRRLLVIGNFSGKACTAKIPADFALGELEILLSNYDRKVLGREMKLQPYEAVLIGESR
ncbi:MAG: alpha-glucosidase C-terminal domain-containing protein, partial [Mogibacterium sp.]|nr:alpha-glucosidase C-terminal domain-containing protein [Mogibacterium sp.]